MTTTHTRRAVLAGVAAVPAVALPAVAIARETIQTGEPSRAILEGYLEFLHMEARMLRLELYGNPDYEFTPLNTITRGFHFPHWPQSLSDMPAASSRAISVLNAIGINAESKALEDDRALIEMGKKLAAGFQEHLKEAEAEAELALSAWEAAEKALGYTLEEVKAESVFTASKRMNPLYDAYVTNAAANGHELLAQRIESKALKLDRLAVKIERQPAHTVAGLGSHAVAALWFCQGMMDKENSEMEFSEEKLRNFLRSTLATAGLWGIANLTGSLRQVS